MTVKMLKEILEKCNDDDRVIIDADDNLKATPNNEIIYAIKHRRIMDPVCAPVVVLQTRADFDVEEELRAALEHYEEENWTEEDALAELFEMGYTIADFVGIGQDDWARRVALEHGLI